MRNVSAPLHFLPSLAMLTALLAIALAQPVVSQVLPAAKPAIEILEPSTGANILLGTVTRADMQKASYCDWLEGGYHTYTPEADVLRPYAAQLKRTQFTVYMGTWCGDSRRELPRLLRILDELGVPEKNVQIIALQRTPTKQGINGEEQNQHIHHVPAIVALKDGKEIGRITERPVVTLERDLAQIVSGGYYVPFYYVSELIGPYVDQGASALAAALPGIMEKHGDKLRSVYELATYARMLREAKKYDEALLLLTANKQEYDSEPIVYEALANLYIARQENDKAYACLLEGLQKNLTGAEHLRQRLAELTKPAGK